MMGHGTKFGRKKEETIAALLSQRNIEEVRLEKLGKLFPEKPVITRKQAISHAAVQQMSGEDLMVLRRMIIAGRPLLPSTERESEAVAAYRSAIEKVIRLTEAR